MNPTDTATHRLSLLLLCDLLRSLDAKSANGFDFGLIADLVELGHRWAVPIAYPRLLGDDGPCPGDRQVAQAQNVLLSAVCAVKRHFDRPTDGAFDAPLVDAFLQAGHRWALPVAYPLASGLTEPPDAVVDSVRRVLQMWDGIEGAIERLPPEELALLKRQAREQNVSLRFNGFDPESEADAINVAHVYVRKLGLFPRYLNRDLYVLAPQAAYYEGLLKRYEETRRTLGPHLTLARLQGVLLKPGSVTL